MAATTRHQSDEATLRREFPYYREIYRPTDRDTAIFQAERLASIADIRGDQKKVEFYQKRAADLRTVGTTKVAQQ